jgi:hypothetical protein
MEMEWWWWLVIALGVALLCLLCVLLALWMRRRRQQDNHHVTCIDSAIHQPDQPYEPMSSPEKMQSIYASSPVLQEEPVIYDTALAQPQPQQPTYTSMPTLVEYESAL